MNSITVSAPAKINLMLDVTGRRSDGYHTLVTVMQSISLADTVFIELNDSGKLFFDCRADGIPDGKENIAYRAAEAFLNYSGVTCGGLYISVHKHIPFQAGLGGGSADCAAVLTGLNKLLGTGYSEEKLCDIGVKLGADVPFCIAGGTKICKGIGEVMSPAPPLEDCFIVIGKGSKCISTKKAFEAIDSGNNFAHEDITDKYDGTIASIKHIGRNIFEDVSDCGDVFAVKEILLQHGVEYAAMSGSGSAVFGLFRKKELAENACKALNLDGFFSEICVPVHCGSYGAASGIYKL